MDKKKQIEETLNFVDVMIEHADNGVSGFWTDDFEGCGNPDIYPEFEKGLISHGYYIKKEHYRCPWEKTILFGGKLNSIGCFYHCAIREAKYLSPEMIRNALKRFKKNLISGKYDYENKEYLKPLIAESEIKYIEKQKVAEKRRIESEEKEKEKSLKQFASSWLSKYLKYYKEDKEYIKNVIAKHYKQDTVFYCEDGVIYFSPDDMKKVEGTENMSYDEYLHIQFQNHSKRKSFLSCYLNSPSEFKGCIEKLNDKFICFKRIFVTGMYLDDCSFFDGKEDHVWIPKEGFENYNVGDCVCFEADVYRYIKKGNGKLLEYGLKKPTNIKKIESYRLPSDKELAVQNVDYIICDSCYLNEQCNGMRLNFCMMPPKEIKALKRLLSNAIISNLDDKKER
ncbi:hypothetical protein [Ruminococcus flavefaciens]|uniref:hypothetical protein n=1 Tax=Ruminococcus flavefaciens TaxID=1265 RepID=UPI000466E538|nr:hypothetical protein [Ruminococcus flavefaciens]